MKLRRPRLEDQAAVLDMMAEYEERQCYPNGLRSSAWNASQDFADWLRLLREQETADNLPAGWVPSVQFLFFDEEDRPVGFLALRLLLNEKLFIEGGHIGYSIRPSQRGRGYGQEQLHLGLIEAKKRGLDFVLVTCDEDNEASRRTILANGGVYDNTIAGHERFWIDVEAA
ncbi:GNAT family N-acetyltransferase [Streptococcus panodentis]|uniref:GNAT family N-acetyltransferase n=1 Tax=Streptococcus panodentis TaxID=1581472 RepID=A0ABS5AW78_9STRE|nr:GNAT family N-acetyltransferase [Streptococcus panodentis]MBP2620745.1 GNAT family N-acetyltransferase [Streptococcus panodentis]